MTAVLDRLLKNSIFYLGAQIAVPLISFVSIPIYTRLFTTSEYGNFVIILTAINFMFLFGNSWVCSSVLRFCSAYNMTDERDQFLSTIITIMAISLLVISVVGALLFSFKFVLPTSSGSLIVLVVLVFILNSVFDLFLTIARADENAKLYSVFSVLFTLCKISVGIIILFFFHRIEGVLIGWIIVNAVFTGFLMLKMRIPDNVGFRNISAPIARTVTVYGLPLIFAGVGGLALSQMDRFMVMHYRGSVEVGIYNVGYLIASYSISIFFTFLMMSAYPSIVSVWEEKGRGATQDLVSDLLRIYLILCVPALFGVSMLSKEIFTVLLTEEYLMGYKIIPWVASGTFMVGILQYYQKSTILLKKSHYYGGLYLLGAVLNFLLNVLLIPRYGFMGAAWATTISYVLLMISTVLLNKFILDLHWPLPGKSLLRVSIASIFMGAVLYYLKGSYINGGTVFGLSFLIFIGIIVYLGLLRLFNEIRREEMVRVFSFVNSRMFRK
jgi:O-antigen/teichoic acid export membrane protein